MKLIHTKWLIHKIREHKKSASSIHATGADVTDKLDEQAISYKPLAHHYLILSW